MHRLLIVHPDPTVRELMTSMLQSLGHRIDEAANDRVAARMLDQSSIDLVLAGAEDDVSEALELINFARRKQTRTPIILFSAAPQPEQMREASQHGAVAFLRFPLPASQLRAAVSQALPDLARTPSRANTGVLDGATPAYRSTGGQVGQMARHGNGSGIGLLDLAIGSPPSNGHVNGYRVAGESRESYPLISHDPTMRQVIDLAEAIAPRRSSVLIVGERGTGKKTLARLLHARSPRHEGVFEVFSCRGQRGADLEAELFGRGSDKGEPDPGLLARVAGGTLFLDDVQCLSPALQAHVLRIVRDTECHALGERGPRIDTRLVLGCSEELGPLVERGEFRSDLFYALSAVTIQLPPLRHRGEDIVRLAEFYRELYARQLKKSIVGISPDACRRLASHDWPENVTELKSQMERAVSRCRGHWIEPNHLSLDAPSNGRDGLVLSDAARQSIIPLKEALEEPEKRLILEALRALNWNRQETARMLDINRTTLYKKMKKYGLIFEEPVWAN